MRNVIQLLVYVKKNISKQFLSDDQEYRALLIEEETAEFHLTL